MSPIRQNSQTFRFDAGEVAPEHYDRIDSERHNYSARKIRNATVTPSGGVRIRPEIQNVTGWLTGFRSGSHNDYRIFPYLAPVANGNTIKYGLVLSDGNSGTVQIAKFSQSGGMGANFDTITDPSPGSYLGDHECAAAQMGRIIVLVSELFPPQLFSEPSNVYTPTLTSGSVSQMQFWKELQGTVTAIEGEGFISFDQYGVPDTELVHSQVIRIGGIEVTVDNYSAGGFTNGFKYVSATADAPAYWQVRLTAAWSKESIQGVRCERKWPQDFTAKAGNAVDDGYQNTAGFHPRTVAWYQNRLVLACQIASAAQIANEPTHIWMSAPGGRYDVIEPAKAYAPNDQGVQQIPSDAPISAIYNLGSSDRIIWIHGGERLYVATTRGIFILDDGPIDAGNPPGLKLIASVGADQISPTDREGKPVFVSADSNAILGVRYNADNEAFERDDISFYARHLTPGAQSIAMRSTSENDPVERLYVVNEDGNIATAMISQQTLVPAWSLILPPQEQYNGSNLYLFDSVFTIGDAVCATLRRTSDSKVAIVRFDDTQTDGYVLDFRNAATTRVSGTSFTTNVEELKGRDVFAVVKVTGASEYTALGWVNVDANGAFSITSYENAGTGEVKHYGVTAASAANVILGLPVVATIIPAVAQGQDNRGSGYGRKKRQSGMTAKIRDTRQIVINGAKAYFPSPMMSVDLPERTGFVRVFMLGWQHEREVTIRSEPPWTLQLENVIYEVGV